MIWRHLDRPTLGFANSWSLDLARLERERPGLFPDLRVARTLVVTSDYSGCHKGARFETTSFLLASLDGCEEWERKRSILRRRLLPQGRRMSFKNLNDRHRRDALASFLVAANDIPGIVVSFCVSRGLDTALCADEMIDRRAHELAPLALFPKTPFRRLMRLSTFVGLFLAGLSAPMQDVLWLSDEDEIVADAARIRAAARVVANAVGHFLPHDLGHFRFGCTRSDDGSRAIEDLAAIPDLAAGAMTETMTLAIPDGGAPLGPLPADMPSGLSVKARYILGWMANGRSVLKKLTCVLSPGDDPSTLRTQWIQLWTAPSLVEFPPYSSMLYKGSIFGGIP
jgi:hypothetical protein